MASTKKKTCSEKENGQNNPSLADDDMNMEQDVMDASDSMSSSSDEEEDEMDIQEKINVEFEARNPEEMDFHGIRQLLLQLFLKSNVDISGLTNWILSLNVGSVIKQYFEEDGEEEEEEDDIDYNQVYGVISCLNISNTKEKVFADQVKKHLLEKLSDEQQAVARLRSILDDPANNIGFIVNERFVNIPPQIAEPSFSSLRQEMQTANEKGDDYNCSHFVLIAKKFRMKVSGKSGKKRRSKKPLDPEIYSNAEEEFFAEAAELKASYSVAGERDSGVVQQWDSELEDQYEPIREVIVFRSGKLTGIMNKIHQHLSQSNT